MMAPPWDIETGQVPGEEKKDGQKNNPDEDKRGGAGKWLCCGRGEGEEAEEKEAYKKLMEDLKWAEETNVSGWHKTWVVVEFTVISGLAAAMACTLTLEQMKHQRLYGLRMWQYVMMATALFAGLSIIRWLTKAVFGPVLKSRWMLHRNVGYYMREMKTTVDVALWFCTVLGVWYVWFRPRLKHVYKDVSVVLSHQLTRLLIAACLGSLLWVAKSVLFFWLEADLHYRQLCDHITRTICQLHVLQILHKYGVWTFLNSPENKKRLQELVDPRSPGAIADALCLKSNCFMPNKPKEREKLPEEEVKKLHKSGKNICMQLLKVKRDTVPVLILRRLCEEYMDQAQTRALPVNKQTIQNPEKLMEQALKLFADMKHANRDSTSSGSKCWESEGDDDEVKLVDLKQRYDLDNKELKLFKSKITQREKSDSNDENEQDDKKDKGGDCNKACPIEGGDSKKDVIQEDDEIGRDEFCSWAVVAYRNCWGLRNTLNSSEQIILKLNRMMTVFVLLLSLIIWLLLSEIVDSAQIALLFSPLLAAKFIFSESTKNMFDGLIFALAMHPFNPGDRVIVHGMELLVMEINILSTTFYKYQSGEELVYPNSELATTQIINLENVPDQSDHIEFTIPKETALEDIRDLEIKIQISLDYRRDAFRTKVVKTEMGLENIKMTVHFNYVGSYLTCEMKAVHRSEMLSTIMHLQKKMLSADEQPQMPPTDKQPQMPLTCKPYIVDLVLTNKVKLEHVQTIKDHIIESVSKYCNRDQCELKVVLNNVFGKNVRMAFYIWNKSLQQHEIISKPELDGIQNRIFGKDQPEASSKTGIESDKAGSSQKLVFSHIQIQTQPGVAEIKYPDVSDKKTIEDAIKRYFCKTCYQYEFEVKIEVKQQLYVYAWRQFPHGIEEEEHHLDVQHILEKNMDQINELKELTGVQANIQH